MIPDWWPPMAAELERLRSDASLHNRRGDPMRWSTVDAMAKHHERMCLALLRHHGWVADHWGQALISEELRAAIKATTCPARWSPDILAIRGREWVLIDCKAEVKVDTPNYSLEAAALDAMFAWTMANTDEHGDCGYVWHDFSWTPAHAIHLSGDKWRGPLSTNGSGTPYWLIPKTIGSPFRDRFAIDGAQRQEGVA